MLKSGLRSNKTVNSAFSDEYVCVWGLFTLVIMSPFSQVKQLNTDTRQWDILKDIIV